MFLKKNSTIRNCKSDLLTTCKGHSGLHSHGSYLPILILHGHVSFVKILSINLFLFSSSVMAMIHESISDLPNLFLKSYFTSIGNLDSLSTISSSDPGSGVMSLEYVLIEMISVSSSLFPCKYSLTNAQDAEHLQNSFGYSTQVSKPVFKHSHGGL